MNKLELQKKAVDVRKGAVTGVYCAKSGHPGWFTFGSRYFHIFVF